MHEKSVGASGGNGRYVADMRNYYLGTTGTYYFPGLITAVLPMIPGIYAIYRVTKASRQRAGSAAGPSW